MGRLQEFVRKNLNRQYVSIRAPAERVILARFKVQLIVLLDRDCLCVYFTMLPRRLSERRLYPKSCFYVMRRHQVPNATSTKCFEHNNYTAVTGGVMKSVHNIPNNNTW